LWFIYTVTFRHITVEPMPKLYCKDEAISCGILFLIFLTLFFELAFTRHALSLMWNFLTRISN
jgi:hypothetical protein